MAAVTIRSGFGAQENKSCHCFNFFPSICHEVSQETGTLEGGNYLKTIEDLRAQILPNSVDNAHIILQIDNAPSRLAADDIRVKYETELATRQSVESDIHRLCRLLSLCTCVTQLQPETEIEALKQELLFMRKNHEEKVKGLQSQAANSGLPWNWMPSNLRTSTRSWQTLGPSLDIVLYSMRNLKANLENSLKEVEAHYAMQMEQALGALLNIKVKLEAEINTSWHLLEDGEDFSLDDALDSNNSMQVIQKTTNLRLVDSKVVSEVSDAEVLRH
ncbi:hypothetical protein FD755_001409 [Muntiacus reevesi]|uniref:IF rod domain-containing protein n=1 Tax=Muntiacus reevesi TaxID=9886 RepID=A0A5J5N3D3_MUNRE|nr:hypothetical protein FD755_001409 [Muntiacus reevesi]